ncbi:MAG: patatin-like phospholipase family protein [Candidatus Manganitrophaceae bacterium]|nr:MAG: patatin-like phospholipase family protein [Candidatus Manganitrophaceae bacterium]
MVRIIAIPLLFFLFLSSAACALVPGKWRPTRNGLAEGSPPPTHANVSVDAKEREDGMFFGLALSGGGSRAANFAGAVMLELQKRGLLDRVDYLSSVSGGSLPAAYYALEGYKGIVFSEEEVKARMARDFQNRWIGRWFLPHNFIRYWFTDFTRSDIMVQVFDAGLYHGATYADLNPKRPKLLINATDHGTADRFTFTDESFSEIGSALPPYKIAGAVNVSSAFPGAFQSVTLQNFKPPDPHKSTYLHLYDGGPVDNLGITSLLSVLRSALGPATMADLFPKGCVILSVDAATRHIDHDSHTRDPRKFVDYFVDRNALDASDVMLLSNRREVLANVGMEGPPYIDIDRFGEFFIYQPENRCRFWHIALRHFKTGDPLGDRVNDIDTKFNIEPEEQQALFEAARRLVEEGMAAGAAGWF